MAQRISPRDYLGLVDVEKTEEKQGYISQNDYVPNERVVYVQNTNGDFFQDDMAFKYVIIIGIAIISIAALKYILSD